MPVMVVWHLPLFWVVQRLTGIPSLWGGVAAIVVYYSVYESFHWAMHVPRASKALSRFRFYRFLDAHHRVHHKYMLSNLNVILPLADLTLGTLRDADGRKVLLFRRRSALPAQPEQEPSRPTRRRAPARSKARISTAKTP
jgi:sterol desaturase/sphingolipid hydroxylase (fatty acid hydroxylase superfamily)